MPKHTFFYCPQCGNKKLRVEHHYPYNQLVCDHNKPVDAWLSRKRRRYSGKPAPVRGAPCGLVISHPDHDATIDDYGTILEKVVAAAEGPEEMFKRELLYADPNIRKKGFEVLHIDDFMTVVRLCNDQGPRVAIYINGFQMRPASFPDNALLTSGAAQYVTYNRLTAKQLFNSHPIVLWKRDGKIENNNGYSGVVFEGSLGKKMKAKIVEWALQFKKDYEDLRCTTVAEAQRWRSEWRELKDKLNGHSSHWEDERRNGVQVEHYDGEHKMASIRIVGSVTPEQVMAIDRFLTGREELSS